jgi:hypothetical protein
MRPSFHPGDDPYLYVQQLAVWQGDVCSCCTPVSPVNVASGDTKERDALVMPQWMVAEALRQYLYRALDSAKT